MHCLGLTNKRDWCSKRSKESEDSFVCAVSMINASVTRVPLIGNKIPSAVKLYFIRF